MDAEWLRLHAYSLALFRGSQKQEQKTERQWGAHPKDAKLMK
jgi:hypothetical protein